ncbi:MAG: hypothetical protein ABII22_01015 [Candidatus Micrarchaeota archaeon]
MKTTTKPKVQNQVGIARISKDTSPKEAQRLFGAFKKLTATAGKIVCLETDLPFGKSEHREWHEAVEAGERTVLLALKEGSAVGTFSIVEGALPVLSITDGIISSTVDMVVAGLDLTAAFILENQRGKGVCRALAEEVRKTAVEQATGTNNDVHMSISTGEEAYEITNPILARMLGKTNEEIEGLATVVLFSMFAGMKGKTLTSDEMKGIVDITQRIGINPDSAAIKTILDSWVSKGNARFVGHSVDGAEPVWVMHPLS